MNKKNLCFLLLLELNINPSLNSRLMPAHMQGQQSTAATGSTVGNTSNPSASSTNDKPATTTTTNPSNNSPTPTTVTPNANGPNETNASNNLDEQTIPGGETNTKDHS